MNEDRKMPPFEQSLAALLLGAKEAVIGPMRLKLRAYNITEPQWRVLRVINDRGDIDATGLADIGLLHAPSVTRILKDLEARKLISRQVDPGDRRRASLVLSPAGQEIVEAVSHDVMDIMEYYAARFGSDRLERLGRELCALSEAIKSPAEQS